MLTAVWPAAQSRWAWPGRRSRDRGYRWAGWPATWIHASATEDSRTPHILLRDCSASLPAEREGERKREHERAWKKGGDRKMEGVRVFVYLTRNWGRGSSRDSAGVSSVPHLNASSAPLLFHRSRNRVAHTTLKSANTTQQMSRLVWSNTKTQTHRLKTDHFWWFKLFEATIGSLLTWSDSVSIHSTKPITAGYNIEVV